MILDLGNGRELKLPDAMEDGSARLLGRLILQLEQRAKDAEDRSLSLETQFAQLKNEVRSVPAPKDDSAVLAAIAHLEVSLAERLQRLAATVAADRIIVYDEMGAPRSRIA